MEDRENAMRHASFFYPGSRRPVHHGKILGLADPQALPPAGWCSHCGGEVYRRGREICRRCLKKEG